MPFNPKSLDNLKPLKPGCSGNPKGRKKGVRSTASVFKDILRISIKKNLFLESIKSEEIRNLLDRYIKGTRVTIDEAIFMVQALKAIKGDTQAANLFMKYSLELPRQNIDMNIREQPLFPDVKKEDDNVYSHDSNK